MKFSLSILALLAGSVASFAPLSDVPVAFAPGSAVKKNSSSALNGIFEVVIGTGHGEGGGTDFVELTLYDENGSSDFHNPTAGTSRNNYQRGSIELNTSIVYNNVDKPVQAKFRVKDNWSYGAVWVTNLETGKCYYHVAPNPGTKIKDNGTLTLDLAEIKPVSEGGEYSMHKLTIQTGGNGTKDKVWCKIVDKNGKANSIMRPGAVDDVLNPVNDWAKGSTQSAWVQTNSGNGITMTDAQYVLLAKYGTDQWAPTKVNVQGLDQGLLGTDDGPIKSFYPGDKLNEDNNKWRWMKVSE